MDNLERILAIELMNALKQSNIEDRYSQVYRNVFELYREEVL
jgi:histidine ammonia-lyase